MLTLNELEGSKLVQMSYLMISWGCCDLIALGPVKKPHQNVFMELNFTELSCVVFLASFSGKYEVLIVSFVSVKWHKLTFAHAH